MNYSASVLDLDSNCVGGGGAGGRVALHLAVDAYTGKISAYGGSGHECGGAGTVLKRNTESDYKELIVDNEDVCTPLSSRVEWSLLSDTHRGQLSHHTWIVDESLEHVFDVSLYCTQFCPVL